MYSLKLKEIKENTMRETLLESVCNALQQDTKETKVIKSETETTRMTFSWKKEIKKRVEELLKRQDRFHERSPVTVFIGARAQKCIRMTSLIKAHDSVRT